LKRRVRAGDFREQARSTWLAIVDALSRQDAQHAAELAAYTVGEAKFNADCMTQWRADMRKFLLGKGVSADDIARCEDDVLGLLRLPDGRRFDIVEQWNAYIDAIQSLQTAALQRCWDEALAMVPLAREIWRATSDRDVDWCSALLNEAVVR